MPRRALGLLSLVILAVAVAPPAASAARLKLTYVRGLPAGDARQADRVGAPAARDLAIGPGNEMWMTGEALGQYIARISPRGRLIGVYPVPGGGSPDSITRGPDGAMWFTLRDGDAVGRISRSGSITTFPAPYPDSLPRGIALGPDGALWVALFGVHRVARLTTEGEWTVFEAGLTPGGEQLGMSSGPGGGVWFTEPRGDRVARISPSGRVTGFQVSTASGPEDIARGVDGNMWFTEDDGNRVGRVTPGGVVDEFQNGITPGGKPFQIAAGPDDAMWFTEADGDRVGRVTPDGFVTEYELPTDSQPWGILTGPDRQVWVALSGSGKLARFSPPLAPVVPATIAYSASTTRGITTFSQLRVEGVPRVARVVVLCRTRGCPIRRFTVRGGRARIDLRRRVRRLRPGAQLQVRIVARGYSTKVRVFRATERRVTVVKRCIAPNSRRLRKGCG